MMRHSGAGDFLSRATRPTLPNPCVSRSPLCVGLLRDATAFSLVRTLPSTASARADAPLFGDFIGTTAQSDSSAAYMSGLRLLAFPDRSALADTTEVSRFSCMLFLDVLGVSDYAGPEADSRNLTPVLRVGFPRCSQGRRPELRFRSSIPSPSMPLSTLRQPPHDDPRKTRGQDGFAFLSCRALSSPTTCRFIPALKHYAARLPRCST